MTPDCWCRTCTQIIDSGQVKQAVGGMPEHYDDDGDEWHTVEVYVGQQARRP